MQGYLSRWWLAFLLGLLSSSVWAQERFSIYEHELQALEQIQQRLWTLKSKLQSELNQSRQELTAAQNSHETLRGEWETLQALLAESQQNISALQGELLLSQVELMQLQQVLADSMKSLHALKKSQQQYEHAAESKIRAAQAAPFIAGAVAALLGLLLGGFIGWCVGSPSC